MISTKLVNPSLPSTEAGGRVDVLDDPDVQGGSCLYSYHSMCFDAYLRVLIFLLVRVPVRLNRSRRPHRVWSSSVSPCVSVFPGVVGHGRFPCFSRDQMCLTRLTFASS